MTALQVPPGKKLRRVERIVILLKVLLHPRLKKEEEAVQQSEMIIRKSPNCDQAWFPLSDYTPIPLLLHHSCKLGFHCPTILQFPFSST